MEIINQLSTYVFVQSFYSPYFFVCVHNNINDNNIHNDDDNLSLSENSFLFI